MVRLFVHALLYMQFLGTFIEVYLLLYMQFLGTFIEVYLSLEPS